MLKGSVTASLIGYVLLMHVKELGQLLIGISSLPEKISRGLYYERIKLSYLCTAEYTNRYSNSEMDAMEKITIMRTRTVRPKNSFIVYPRNCKNGCLTTLFR